MSAEPKNVGISEFLDMLEALAPIRFAEEWDNPGLQVGGYQGDITRVFVSLDPTLSALKRARSAGAQVLFTHHPLIFEPLRCVDSSGYPGNVIQEAVRSGIHVVAAHTNLDVAKGGINDILAELIHLEDVAVLDEISGVEGVGLGRIGRVARVFDLPAFIHEIRDLLGIEALAVTGPEDARIQTVAVVGGSGGSLVHAARKKGADCLVTGDVGHHHALAAETVNMTLLDAGHYCLEKKAFSIFGERLKEKVAKRGWNVDVVLDEAEQGPVRRV